MSNDESLALPEEGIRINKYLASCGYESRRKADQLIADGVVEINGKRVETPGVRVMPGDFVKVNGHRALPKDEATLLLNKPRGFVCSRDPQGAEGTVYDLLPPKYRYVNYVGRLDVDSEGLLILTNKGALNQRLGHPNNGVEKEYWVTLNQTYDNSVLLQLLKGVRIPEGQAKAKYISRLSPRRACVVLEQGLKRQVRQMFACLGFRVRKLVRVRIGSLWGGDLAPGRAMLMTEEQEKLACTNPPQRKGMISAAQAFPKSGSISREQLDHALDEKTARAALEEETDYVFNPADFETEEEAESSRAFRSWDDEEPAPRSKSRGYFRVQQHEPRDPRGGCGSSYDRHRADDRENGRRGRSPFHRMEESDRSFAPRKRSFGDRRRDHGDSREGGFSRSRSFGAPRRFRDSSSDERQEYGGAERPRRFRRSFDEQSDRRPQRQARYESRGGDRSFGRGRAARPDSFRGRPGSHSAAPKRGKRF